MPRIRASSSTIPLISELCSHDQSWAREACGDLWLGFEQEDLSRWASAAGLLPGESLYIGLKNGFQIQLRHFAQPLERAAFSYGTKGIHP